VTGLDASEDAARRRMCAVSRERLPEERLLRFVRAPDGTLVPDVKRKLPGRGVWVEARREAIAQAQRRKVFARGLQAQVTVPDDLAGEVERLFRARVVQALALANKAGLVVTGFDKVAEALGRGRVRFLLHAAEASEDGVRKLARPAAHSGATRSRLLTEAELNLALGRPHVIHAAAMEGAASAPLAADLARLAYFVGADEVEPSTPVESPIGSDPTDFTQDAGIHEAGRTE
jgi:predicted RNA-binding protein YlxR (DUF448 family)